jgi:hypothetical protein
MQQDGNAHGCWLLGGGKYGLRTAPRPRHVQQEAAKKHLLNLLAVL